MQWKLFFMTYFDRHFTYLISVNYTCDHPLSVYVCYKGCLIVVSMSAVYMCMYVAIGVLLLFQCLLSICVCMLQWVSYYCFNVLSICVCMLQWVSYYCFNVFCLYVIYMFK